LRQPALDLVGQRRHHVGGYRVAGLDVLGLRHLGHRQLMFGAVLILLERGGEEEDRATVLDRGYPAHRETAAVARPVGLVADRRGDVAGLEEVGVQRVRGARLGQRRLRGRQRLSQHLAPENVLGTDVAALAAEQIDLEALERKQVDQLGNGGGHARSPGAGAAIIPAAKAWPASRSGPAAPRSNYSGMRWRSTAASTFDHGNSGPGSRLRGTCRAGSSVAATVAVSRSSWPATRRNPGRSACNWRSRATSASICTSGYASSIAWCRESSQWG